MKYLKLPPKSAYIGIDSCYHENYSTYSEYNYLRPGIISKLKRRRFDIALSLSRVWFGTTGVIDMGCADGIFLPSLAHYFPKAIGIERNAESCKIASNATAHLKNVTVICDSGENQPQEGCGIMFLLEVLEHVGNRETMYEDKVAFLKNMLATLEAPRVIIASVPRMMGPLFVLKYFIQCITGMVREELTIRELVSVGLFFNSDTVQHKWAGEHLGFNEYKLTKILREHFEIEVLGTLTSVFYVVRGQQ
jgi:2-polyprenyl-3-methyl-5-hydroxy-6-metoxy-1,4-benzoquinol methylase